MKIKITGATGYLGKLITKKLIENRHEVTGINRKFLYGSIEELQAEIKQELDIDFKGIPYLFFSSVAQQGLMELKDKLWGMLNNSKL